MKTFYKFKHQQQQNAPLYFDIVRNLSNAAQLSVMHTGVKP
ncbi:hypothetical protein [Pseudoalteromonas luteoviolacea]|uniref:Uncharacterized protein n=1 Tax=Pseudoalteromonas luteoviolacea S4060-1 TaxID=1365257 RepID=A0A162BS92_9GAMM|nr:hypothetical protein [Pseudoalteromonas luteoviolacea]KZN67553.1 hypothetical protein N478_02020 [Pseudoalteromonas luteoviolacea S4060-1]